MLTSVEIRNYRAFKRLRMDGLGRINLVAGSNNSGKTSLLEALFLLAGGADASMAVHSYVVRSGFKPDASQDTIAPSLWHPLFFGLDPANAIEIVGVDGNGQSSRLSITLGPADGVTISDASRFGGRLATNSIATALSVAYRSSSSSERDPLVSRIQFESGRFVASGNHPPPVAVAMLPVRHDNAFEDAIHLSEFRKRKQSGFVSSALRILEPKLSDVEVITGADGPVIWADVGLSQLIPLAVMGEAMVRLATLLLAIGTMKGGIVLVDEVENGYHHGIVEAVWNAIEEAAVRFNVQIVATTHSYECIMAAHDACDGDNLVLHRLDRHGDEHRCVTYDEETIEAAISHNFEVR